MKYRISDTECVKVVKSDNYNFIFSKKTGDFARWGKNVKDDPSYSLIGPEIADIEISSGYCTASCPFCYKDNGSHHKNIDNMSLETFKIILSKMPKTLTQIAFGICDIDTNPDFINIMKHSKENGIIPNFTCNGRKVTNEFAKEISNICGAVAVSVLPMKKRIAYKAIKMFTDAGMTQVNIHFVLSEESYEEAFNIVNDMVSDSDIMKVNAIVFLQYKPKNKKSSMKSMIDVKKYAKLVEHCEKKGINFGFDSCSAHLFMKSIKDNKYEKRYQQAAEPCESTCFSIYLNWKGEVFPCSFCEKEQFKGQDWTTGVSVLTCNNFLEDIWNSSMISTFRQSLLDNDRKCPAYDI